MITYVHDLGLTSAFYNSFIYLGIISILIFNTWYAKKYYLSKHQAFLITIIALLIAFPLMYIIYWVESGFKSFGEKNFVRVLPFIPLILLIIARLMKKSWAKICDFFAPCICLIQGVSHFGCIFAGCCRGYEFPFGIYNPQCELVVFPIQLLESIVSLTIVVILVYRAQRTHYKVNGTTFPLMMILFGFSRFFLEFGRANEKLVLGLSLFSLYSLFTGTAGLIAFRIIKKKNQETELLNLEKKKKRKRKK